MNENLIYNIPEELMDIIPAYLDRRVDDIHQLNLLISHGDYKGVMKIAHKLKGNGSSFGFERITFLGDLLNEAAKHERVEELKKLVQEFSIEIQQIKFHLDPEPEKTDSHS